MRPTEHFYQRWITEIAKTETKRNIKRHIRHHAKQLDDPLTNNPISWAASMYNLLKIYEEVHGIHSTIPIQLYKLQKKYNKNKRIHTPPPGGYIPKNVKMQWVEAVGTYTKKKA